MMELVLLLALVLAGVAYVAWPLLSDPPAAPSGPPGDAALPGAGTGRKETEEALADLEYDFRSGKLSAGDYERLGASLRSRLEGPADDSPEPGETPPTGTSG